MEVKMDSGQQRSIFEEQDLHDLPSLGKNRLAIPRRCDQIWGKRKGGFEILYVDMCLTFPSEGSSVHRRSLGLRHKSGTKRRHLR